MNVTSACQPHNAVLMLNLWLNLFYCMSFLLKLISVKKCLKGLWKSQHPQGFLKSRFQWDKLISFLNFLYSFANSWIPLTSPQLIHHIHRGAKSSPTLPKGFELILPSSSSPFSFKFQLLSTLPKVTLLPHLPKPQSSIAEKWLLY